MTSRLRNEIDAAELDNDLELLGNMLEVHEEEDDALEVLYEAIDRVAAKLDNPVQLDEIWTLS